MDADPNSPTIGFLPNKVLKKHHIRDLSILEMVEEPLLYYVHLPGAFACRAAEHGMLLGFPRRS